MLDKYRGMGRRNEVVAVPSRDASPTDSVVPFHCKPLVGWVCTTRRRKRNHPHENHEVVFLLTCRKKMAMCADQEDSTHCSRYVVIYTKMNYLHSDADYSDVENHLWIVEWYFKFLSGYKHVRVRRRKYGLQGTYPPSDLDFAFRCSWWNKPKVEVDAENIKRCVQCLVVALYYLYPIVSPGPILFHASRSPPLISFLKSPSWSTAKDFYGDTRVSCPESLITEQGGVWVEGSTDDR